jgi:putative membrane protein
VKLIYALVGALSAAGLAVTPASATLPTPPAAAAPGDAQAFLFHGGAGDIFEITKSMLAIQHSQNPQVRAFARMLIADHTNLTNTNLATAKAAGVMPPPPELTPMQKGMITQLLAAAPADFDRVYLTQQIPAHQMALQIMQGYARSGDVPQLRQAAAGAVPIVQGHLAHAQQLLVSVR